VSAKADLVFEEAHEHRHAAPAGGARTDACAGDRLAPVGCCSHREMRLIRMYVERNAKLVNAAADAFRRSPYLTVM
jgi:hypothetical protein